VAELAAHRGLGIGARLAARDALFHGHLQVRTHFGAQFAVLIVAPHWKSHRFTPGLAVRLCYERRSTLRLYKGFRMPATAAAKASHLERCRSSWRLPVAVSRYCFTRWLFSLVFQSLLIQRARSSRCSAG